MGSPLLVVVGLAVAPGFAAQRPDSVRSLDQAFRIAQEASGARDWKTTRRALEAALRFSPESPPALYNLARAEARLGNGTAAIRALERLVGQGVARAVQADTAFGSLRDSPAFRDVARRLATSAEPIVRSDTAFVLPDPDFIPEGIAWDPIDSTFYIGSLSGRGIARAAGNRVTTWVRPESARLTQILGLRIDGPRRRLWVASLTVDTAAPRFFRGVGGWAALEAYQLPGGRRLGRWVPDSSGPHLLNDIAVAPGGDVCVTDSEGSALHRLASGQGVLERAYHDPERFVYPNGIALAADGSRAYVAHFEGLSVFDLGAGGGAPAKIDAAPGVPTSGIDGLYGCGSGLLAVQYRLDFQQITRFALSPHGWSVTAARALERRHPAQTGATTGAPAGRAFYYIANAQLERLGHDQALRPSVGERSVVLRLPLGNACEG